MTIFQLVYVSLAADSFSADDLLGLLRQSRENNERAEVSGMLLYKERRFLQVLEGDEASVRATFQRIHRDPRHHDITVLLENETEMRDFDDWSMAFQNLDQKNARATPGYSEFMNVTLSVFEFASDPSRASQLLRIFRKT